MKVSELIKDLQEAEALWLWDATVIYWDFDLMKADDNAG